MIKLILKSILLLIITLIIVINLDDFFKERDISTYLNKEYKSNEDNIDLVLFGSSHSQSSYDPRVFETLLGLKTYNFGESAQRFLTTLPLVDEVLSEHDVKIAIVDIYKSSIDTLLLDDNSKGMQLKTLDKLSFSKSKLLSFSSVYDLSEFSNFFPTLRNHNNWYKVNDIDASFLNVNHREVYNGFVTSKRCFNNKSWDDYLKRVKPRKVKLKELSNAQKKLIRDLVKKFEQTNTKLLFVSAPTHNSLYDKSYINTQKLINDYLVSINIDYMDLNQYWADLQLSKTDFKDPNHLNANGAIKVSVFLSNLIKEKYNIQIQSNESISNRYTIVANNNKKAILSEDIKNSILNDSIGIEKLYLYKVFDNYYELLFEGKKDKLKNVHLKITYKAEMSDSIMSNGKSMFIRDGKFITHALLKDKMNYLDNSYKSFRFFYPREELINFKLFLSPKKNVKVIDIKKIELK